MNNDEINVEILDEAELNITSTDGWNELPYEEKDPLFKESPAYNISNDDINNWNNKSEFSGNYNDLSNKPTIPDELSDLSDDSAHRLVTDTEKTTWNNKSDFSGSYNDLTNKPTIPTVPTTISSFTNDSGYITNSVNNLTNYTLKTNTGSLIDLSVDITNYVVTLQLKNQDGTVISTDTIDLPLESVVVGGSYDKVNKKVILTLENGNTVEFSVADLVAGLQTELTSTNKLNSDYVDDTNSGNKFVTTSEKQIWNNKLDSSDLTDYVKNTDYATDSTGGVVKVDGTSYGIAFSGAKKLLVNSETYTNYLNKGDYYAISKGTLENVLNVKIGDISSALDLLNGEVI